jgi:hypothetical protein
MLTLPPIVRQTEEDAYHLPRDAPLLSHIVGPGREDAAIADTHLALKGRMPHQGQAELYGEVLQGTEM